ncbi:gp54 [Salmonella enterica subsp. enterica serovar Typhi]|nr:gp54 [Salmonella enterica subsp. enterica serovar Typhi]
MWHLVKKLPWRGILLAILINAFLKEFMRFKADLPLNYVRREDYIRGQTVIEAKLDALYNKLEVVQQYRNTGGQ